MDAFCCVRDRQRRSGSGRPPFTWEIIVVDDGSKDRTTEVALRYSLHHSTDRVRVMTLPHNVGKGGAIQQGMLHARGQYMLMVDADGATQITDLEKLESRMTEATRNGFVAVLGSILLSGCEIS
jgi:dolichyl-phosphate beta-glucosyltransferase